MSLSQDVTLIAEQMFPGETIRIRCTACGGGDKREKSMTITLFPNTLVKYNCFRDSCTSNKGQFFLGATENLLLEHQEPRPLVRKEKPKFNGTTAPLTEFEKEYMNKMWGIKDAPTYWWHTHEYGGRIAMSVRSPMYRHRGWVLRDIGGTARSKALTYIEHEEVPLSWHKRQANVGTLLVEDIPSAVRASKYVTSVALLGTGCGNDRGLEIAAKAQRPIAIALDQDATGTAFEILDRWGLLWGDSKVVPLKKDIKNMSDKEVDDLTLRIFDHNNKVTHERTQHTGQRDPVKGSL